jgi:hypothetical protein
MKKLLLLVACVSCSSTQFDAESNGVRDAGSSMCTPPVTDADAHDASDAAADAADATTDAGDAAAHADADASDAADAEASTGITVLFAPWSLQTCWFGTQTNQAVPSCPHGTYVECFGADGGGLSYCDDTPLDCHQDPVSGRWHCPAGTRTLNKDCVLQTDDVVTWPSTYSYACATSPRP